MKRILSVLLAITLLFSLTACGKSDAVINVETLIAEIGEVKLDNEEPIKKAEEAYASLPDEEKSDVETYDQLTAARDKFEKLKAEEEERKRKEAEAKKRKEAIEEVEDLISKITATDIENAPRIEAAKKAYDKLPDEDKAKVKKGKDLAGMLKQVEALKKDAAERLLSAMTLQEDKVRGYSFYYPDAFNWYGDLWAADLSCFVLPYIGRDESGDSWLRVIYNYTGDDWVFFKSITIAADSKRFYKSFKYFDIVHDNDGGLVWEYIDEDPSQSDIEMLWAIANSDETIVRFEGDDYYYDYTVTESDKQSIRDTLTAYNALN